MSCYHPLHAYQMGKGNKLSGFVRSNDVEGLKRWQEVYDSQLCFPTAVEIPCGQCIGCRMTYARNWAIRCMLESTLYPKDSCWFVTLTYDDEHVPEGYACDPKTGEILYKTTPLVKKHLQDFKKRLRENLRRNYGIDNIRTFDCGEYGSKTKRCHFHLIIFGLPYSNLIFSLYPYQNASGILYNCKPVQDSWTFGLCPVAELTFDSAAYVAGYMLKKVKGKHAADWYAQHGLTPEFSSMSNRPGIGRGYFDMHTDEILKDDRLPKFFPGLNCCPRPPEYFDRIIGEMDPDEFAIRKAKRKFVADTSLQAKLREVGLSKAEYLAKEEERVKSGCSHRSNKI